MKIRVSVYPRRILVELSDRDGSNPARPLNFTKVKGVIVICFCCESIFPPLLNEFIGPTVLTNDLYLLSFISFSNEKTSIFRKGAADDRGLPRGELTSGI